MRRNEVATTVETANPALHLLVERVRIGGLDSSSARGAVWTSHARTYVEGLMLPGERRSMQPLAARDPDATYEAVQHFITDSPWDWKDTQRSLVDVMRDESATPNAVLIIDDVPLEKQGDKSPGVARQYSGQSGGIQNSQALVDLVYAVPSPETNRDAVCWAVGLELYLPKAWAEDPARCQKAGIPTPVEFKQKWRIALDLVERARAHDLSHRVVLADMWYGDVGPLRSALRDRGEAYVLAVTPTELHVVPRDTTVSVPARRSRGKGGKPTKPRLPDGQHAGTAAAVAASVDSWTRLEWSQGTKGPLVGEFARIPVRVCRGRFDPTEELGWLLLEKTTDGFSSWMCWGVDDASLLDLARWAHARWLIERFHEEAKMELGLDHFEGRTWRGLNHHITLVMLAHAHLALERLRARAESESNHLPTLAAVKRGVAAQILVRLIESTGEPLDAATRERWNRVARHWMAAG